jgi:hydrogenase maturation protease
MIDCKQNGEWSSFDIESSIQPTVLIVGLGNPILGDDGVGWRVAEKVAQHLHPAPSLQPITPNAEGRLPFLDFEVDCLALGGLSLMERIIGYERAIIIDALSTGQHPVGTVIQTFLSELPDHALGHLCSAHDTTLQTALRLGRSMGAKIPDDIVVVGIETQQVYDFSDELSPAVLDAIHEAFDVVMELLK